jgi:lysophospholipase L1-like esterase
MGQDVHRGCAAFPDLLHPNAAGYTNWAEALKPILAKLSGN